MMAGGNASDVSESSIYLHPTSLFAISYGHSTFDRLESSLPSSFSYGLLFSMVKYLARNHQLGANEQAFFKIDLEVSNLFRICTGVDEIEAERHKISTSNSL
jgi:hypothetical protein